MYPFASRSWGTVLIASLFILAGAGPKLAGGAEDYSLTGIVRIGESVRFSLQNASGSGFWIGLGETVDGVSAIAYDPTRNRVEVVVQGRRQSLGFWGASATPVIPALSAGDPATREREAVLFMQDLLEIQMKARAEYRKNAES